MADEDQDGEGGKSSKGKGGSGLIVTLLVLILLGGGGFGAWAVMHGKKDTKQAAAEVLPPRYINIDPPFVVNFEAEAMVRFLQVTIGVMTRDPNVEKLVKDNDPRVRNDLLMILSNQTYDSVATLEGKEKLRTRCLESVRGIVQEMGGDSAKIEALYFTSFVMQ